MFLIFFQGVPTFVEETDDCTYLFDWYTSLACPPPDPFHDTGLQCLIRFNKAKTNIDLSALKKEEGYEVKFENQVFKINVCGYACNDSGVCTEDGKSYGKATNSELFWDYDELQLNYYNGDDCPMALSNKKTTKIFFICDMSAGFGSPTPDPLMRDLSCMAIFDWRTNLTCLEGFYEDYTPTTTTTTTVRPRPKPITVSPFIKTTTAPSVEEKSSSSSSEQSSSSAAHSAIITLVVLLCLVATVVLVLYKSNRGHRMLTRIKNSFRNTGYLRSNRSRNENVTLLATTTRTFRVDESDDDLLGV